MRGSLMATDLSKPIITQHGTVDATLATQPIQHGMLLTYPRARPTCAPRSLIT